MRIWRPLTADVAAVKAAEIEELQSRAARYDVNKLVMEPTPYVRIAVASGNNGKRLTVIGYELSRIATHGGLCHTAYADCDKIKKYFPVG